MIVFRWLTISVFDQVIHCAATTADQEAYALDLERGYEYATAPRKLMVTGEPYRKHGLVPPLTSAA